MIATWRRWRLRGAAAVIAWSVYWTLVWSSALAEDSAAFGIVIFAGTPLTLLIAQGRGAFAGFLGGVGIFVVMLSALGDPVLPWGISAGIGVVGLAVAAHLGAGRLFERVRRQFANR